jgi:hypothetical protein
MRRHLARLLQRAAVLEVPPTLHRGSGTAAIWRLTLCTCQYRACEPGHPADAKALGQLEPCAGDLLRFGTWPAKARPDDSGLGGETALALDLGVGGAEAGIYALTDHGALELGEQRASQKPSRLSLPPTLLARADEVIE